MGEQEQVSTVMEEEKVIKTEELEVVSIFRMSTTYAMEQIDCRCLLYCRPTG